MNFIEIVLDLINKKGITKNKMLTDLKLGKNSFVNWSERGTIPSGETLSKIAEYFNVSTDYLLGNELKEKSLSEKDRLIADIVNVLYSKTDDELIALRDMLVKFAQSKGK